MDERQIRLFVVKIYLCFPVSYILRNQPVRTVESFAFCQKPLKNPFCGMALFPGSLTVIQEPLINQWLICIKLGAHGHADALSFQMFIDGYPVFVDPGTYIYHCDLESRNVFRKTENHTVCINGKDQSEMLGAFLWGRKAECRLIEFTGQDERMELTASHNGYVPVTHIRRFEFDGKTELVITDQIENASLNEKVEINYIFSP